MSTNNGLVRPRSHTLSVAHVLLPAITNDRFTIGNPARKCLAERHSSPQRSSSPSFADHRHTRIVPHHVQRCVARRRCHKLSISRQKISENGFITGSSCIMKWTSIHGIHIINVALLHFHLSTSKSCLTSKGIFSQTRGGEGGTSFSHRCDCCS